MSGIGQIPYRPELMDRDPRLFRCWSYTCPLEHFQLHGEATSPPTECPTCQMALQQDDPDGHLHLAARPLRRWRMSTTNYPGPQEYIE